MRDRSGTDLAPKDVVASFDSASVLHASLSAALRGKPFPHLGNPGPVAAGVRAVGRLPWALVRPAYTRVGASEGIDPRRLGDVDAAAVAASLADGYPRRSYPAAFLGSSNGAIVHLAAAMGAPWLPGTVLVPVFRRADPGRADEALRFGVDHAPALLRRNPDVVLHHMHDPVQDELMVAHMTYFRLKWSALPDAYARFLAERLAPGAPVVLVEDGSTWPVVRVGERHVFQAGGQGAVGPEAFLDMPHTPRPSDVAAEAEWGADPGLGAGVEAWCAAHGHPVVRVSYRGPQDVAHPVAVTLRAWYRERGEPGERLLVPSFVLAEPWRTVSTATVPYWAFFAVQPALAAFREHLARTEPYREVGILLFPHGVDSAGIAGPKEWLAAAREHGARARVLAVDERRFPRDIAALGRYGRDLSRLPTARRPWSPLNPTTGLDRLLSVGR